MLLFTYLKGRAKQMDYFTKEGMKKLLEDEEVVRRLTEFMAMDGAAYFEEVRSHLSLRSWKNIWMRIRMRESI